MSFVPYHTVRSNYYFKKRKKKKKEKKKKKKKKEKKRKIIGRMRGRVWKSVIDMIGLSLE